MVAKNSNGPERQFLYIRDLTEAEQEKINESMVLSPMQMCPDRGVLDSGEVVDVIHSFNTGDGLNLGFNTAEGKYSTAHISEVKLENPKFHWHFIADRNDKR